MTRPLFIWRFKNSFLLLKESPRSLLRLSIEFLRRKFSSIHKIIRWIRSDIENSTPSLQITGWFTGTNWIQDFATGTETLWLGSFESQSLWWANWKSYPVQILERLWHFLERAWLHILDIQQSLWYLFLIGPWPCFRMEFEQFFRLVSTARFLILSFWKDHQRVARQEIWPSHVTLQYQPIGDHHLNVLMLPQWKLRLGLFLIQHVYSHQSTLDLIYEENPIRFYMLDSDWSIYEWYHAVTFRDFHLAWRYPAVKIIHIHPKIWVSKHTFN